MTHDHAKDVCSSELGPLRVKALYKYHCSSVRHQRSTARPSPVILAPGEYTFSGTGPAGRVYIQALICLCNVTMPILVLSACLTSAWIVCMQ